jgi:hypothetical protein
MRVHALLDFSAEIFISHTSGIIKNRFIYVAAFLLMEQHLNAVYVQLVVFSQG